jgi:parallel beta-helix repeat protein
MKQVAFILSVCVVTTFSVATATLIRVPGEYPTIQAGIDAAVDGDTVLVADGTYTGDGNRDIDFFGKPIVLMSENGPEVTIIDCEGSRQDPHRGFYFQNGEDSSSVVQGFTIRNGYVLGDYPQDCGGAILCRGASSPAIEGNIIRENTALWGYGGGICCQLSSSPIIKGNTIEENTAAESSSYGGGICCYYYSSPTIENNTIERNTADGDGGGILCYQYSSPTIVGNTIRHNRSIWGEGGGISCYDHCSPAIVENLIVRDTAHVMGGGISCYDHSSPTIVGNTITDNLGGWGGGISCFERSSPTVVGNTIAGNKSYAGDGGGIYCCASSLTIDGNTITGNIASTYDGEGSGIWCFNYLPMTFKKATIAGTDTIYGGLGGGIACEGGPVMVLNTILWDDSAEVAGQEIHVNDTSLITVSYSDISGGWEGEGNIDADPLFVLSEYRDYRLLWDSPCIDSGHPDSLDPDGTRSDMGAFPFDQSTPVTIYLTPDTTVYHRYQNLGVTYTVINIDPDPVTFSLQTDVYLPNGKPYPGNPVVGPKEITLGGGKTRQRWIKHYIPGKAPFGVFIYTTTLESVLYDDIIDEDSFRFAIEE